MWCGVEALEEVDLDEGWDARLSMPPLVRRVMSSAKQLKHMSCSNSNILKRGWVGSGVFS